MDYGWSCFRWQCKLAMAYANTYASFSSTTPSLYKKAAVTCVEATNTKYGETKCDIAPCDPLRRRPIHYR